MKKAKTAEAKNESSQAPSYRELLLLYMERKSLSRGRKVTLSEISVHTQIHLSLISNVFKKRLEFSSDQIFLISEFLNCSEDETEHLLIQLEIERQAHPHRKKYFEQKLQRLLVQKSETAKRLNIPEIKMKSELEQSYYLDPRVQLTHVGLGIPKFASDLQKLRRELGISEQSFREILKILEEMNLISFQGDSKVKKLDRARHLPQDSPMLNAHQTAIKHRSINRIQNCSRQESKVVTVTFSSDERSFQKIQEAFLNFLTQAQEIVRNSKNEKLYQLNFDLFPWI